MPKKSSAAVVIPVKPMAKRHQAAAAEAANPRHELKLSTCGRLLVRGGVLRTGPQRKKVMKLVAERYLDRIGSIVGPYVLSKKTKTANLASMLFAMDQLGYKRALIKRRGGKTAHGATVNKLDGTGRKGKKTGPLTEEQKAARKAKRASRKAAEPLPKKSKAKKAAGEEEEAAEEPAAEAEEEPTKKTKRPASRKSDVAEAAPVDA
jgi:hypothetical protein